MIGSPSRRRLSHALRLLALLLFTAGTTLQPVLASLGELHELSDHQTGRPMHLGHAQSSVDHDHVSAAEDHAGDAPEALHALLHFAHCCGQSGALGVPALNVPTTALEETAPSTCELPGVIHAPTHGPFRPPITA